ncbi:MULTISPECIES: UbiH/UbiF family hydroxylase [Mesorhizobium]|uniref:UbiH/UbiF family hydroxylase n=1 Tax=Mesorhizobium denitrificans TaxID=2294114 RepID=A0A371X8S3_9HYPH|nr:MULTISPECIES: UbiH/UbiF family hydroxylase [Mesorhizobium]RFC65601.1 UbiH/UbiF family hydroxylase [Mesorhizobium denitrificans]
MKNANSDSSIIVAGTGPAGLIAALALARKGFAISLVGPQVNQADRRTTALMVPSLQFLDSLGVLDALEAEAAPLVKMRIVDATDRLIRAPVVTFSAAEISEPYFGLNIGNKTLNTALDAAVRAESKIVWHETLVEQWTLGADRATARLANGETLTAKLVVAADGRSSPAREAAGISISTTRLPQSALVLNFAHSRPHGSISTEFHTRTGPFTLVPLKGDRSSLVWVVQPQQADELMALDDATLAARIEERMQSMLGRVSVEPGRQVYPLSNATPRRFAQNRVALVGEAAHIFPPIGAQGLNLGIRDVRDLVDIVTNNADDPGAEPKLSAFDRKRRPDIMARTTAVTLLNRSLLSSMLPSQFARSVGLGALDGIAPLRAIFMREGLRPGSGFSGLFSDLREQIRR